MMWGGDRAVTIEDAGRVAVLNQSRPQVYNIHSAEGYEIPRSASPQVGALADDGLIHAS